MLTLRTTFIGLLLALAGSLSALSIFLSGKAQMTVIQDHSHLPDAFMENVIATVMNKLGKPVLKLDAPKMTHYADNDVTEAFMPHVIIYRQSLEPWHINAKFAKATQGTTEITFWNNVVIHHSSDSDNPVTTMHTSKLTIEPNQQIAKTNEAVIVAQPDTTVHAVGMLANWNDGTVKLLSNAREEYVPHS